MADQRRQQAEKKGIADRYEPGTLVWIKTRPKSDKNKGLTKKLGPIYEGYQIGREVRRNAYLIERQDGVIMGVYNSRRIRPHREPKLKFVQREINMLRMSQEEANVRRNANENPEQEDKRRVEENQEALGQGDTEEKMKDFMNDIIEGEPFPDIWELIEQAEREMENDGTIRKQYEQEESLKKKVINGMARRYLRSRENDQRRIYKEDTSEEFDDDRCRFKNNNRRRFWRREQKRQQQYMRAWNIRRKKMRMQKENITEQPKEYLAMKNINILSLSEKSKCSR